MMGARQSFRIEGMKELDKALGELPRATGKNVLRRVGRKSLEPVIEAAKAKVPVDEGQLRDSLSVSTKLSKRQRSIQRRLVAEGKASVEVFAGATALPHAHLVEFGSVHNAPQPFMRPAWDGSKNEVLDYIKRELWTEVAKSAERLARKQARLAAKAG